MTENTLNLPISKGTQQNSLSSIIKKKLHYHYQTKCTKRFFITANSFTASLVRRSTLERKIADKGERRKSTEQYRESRFVCIKTDLFSAVVELSESRSLLKARSS